MSRDWKVTLDAWLLELCETWTRRQVENIVLLYGDAGELCAQQCAFVASCLSLVCPSFCVPVCVPAYLPVRVSVYRSGRRSPSVRLSVRPSICVCELCLSRLCVLPSVRLSSVCLSLCA